MPRDFIDDTDEEMAERRKYIDQIPEYHDAACMGVLNTFDIHILDKMEGLLKGGSAKSRRYALRGSRIEGATCPVPYQEILSKYNDSLLSR